MGRSYHSRRDGCGAILPMTTGETAWAEEFACLIIETDMLAEEDS